MQDERTAGLAFLAACQLTSLDKAKRWWAKLGADDRDRMAPKCEAAGITRGRLDGTTGELFISSSPSALVYVDDVLTGKTTPAHLEVRVGHHVITLADGDHRHKFTVEIGDTTTVLGKYLH